MTDSSIAVFIDANIFLNFYKYSHADIRTLHDLIDYMKGQHIQVVTTQLLKDEFYRNREARIKEALTKFDEVKPSKKEIPTLFKACDLEYKEFNNAIKNMNDAHSKLNKAIKDKSLNNSLEADNLIDEIFNMATNIVDSDSIYKKAMMRMRKKNPPGKINELGDRLHWESFLYKIKKNKELIIISDDGDFCDTLDNTRIKPFLYNEWHLEKKSKVVFFKKTIDFLQEYAPDFQLKDQTKETILRLLDELKNSSSFSETHRIIAQLNKYFEHLTISDIVCIISCYEKNEQVRWIVFDQDVYEFLDRISNNFDLDEKSKYLINEILQDEE